MRSLSCRQRLVRIGAWLLAGCVVMLMLLRWFERFQVYQPSASWGQDGSVLRRPWEDVRFRARDGVKLSGWFFPATNAPPATARVILLCHGNGGNLSHRLDTYELLLELGVSVFAFDYRGYGRSAGRPSEAGTYADAEGAFDWLRERGFAATNIIAYGESLGGGVATELATRESPGGLILQSTFTSLPDIGAELFPWLPVRWVASIHYDTRAKLGRLHMRVLILHSRADRLIGFHHAERNFAAANEPKRLHEISGDHNDSLSHDRERYLGGVRKFLDELDGARGSNPASNR